MAIRRRLFAAYRLILAGMLFVALLSTPLYAQSDGDSREEITLTPTVKEHSLKPGESIRDSFKVVNTGTATMDFTVYARPYSVTGEDNSSNFNIDPEVNPRSDAYSWVQFEKASWRLEPSDTAEIIYELRVPENASPGGHYGVMFAETQPDNPDNSRAIVGKKRVGSILRVRVDGDIKQAGQPLNINLPWLQFQPPVEATTRVENSGNVDSKATIKMIARDVFGNVKHEQTKETIVYPSFDNTDNVAVAKSTTISWPGAAWFGLYKIDISTSFLDSEISKSSYVLVLPRWLIVLVVVALIGGGYVFFRRQR